MLIVGAGLLGLADRLGGPRESGSFRLRDALLMGIGQAAALQPGVSRSGVTITVARALKFDRVAAARLSFLMSLPIIAGAGVFKFADVLGSGGHPVATSSAPFVVGMADGRDHRLRRRVGHDPLRPDAGRSPRSSATGSWWAWWSSRWRRPASTADTAQPTRARVTMPFARANATWVRRLRGTATVTASSATSTTTASAATTRLGSRCDERRVERCDHVDDVAGRAGSGASTTGMAMARQPVGNEGRRAGGGRRRRDGRSTHDLAGDRSASGRRARRGRRSTAPAGDVGHGTIDERDIAGADLVAGVESSARDGDASTWCRGGRGPPRRRPWCGARPTPTTSASSDDEHEARAAADAGSGTGRVRGA